MSYYKIFGLNKEPFSTSPDPEFFYRSAGHDSALKRLEIAVRLRRGLSLIVGDVGAGKTTLSRLLVQVFDAEPDFISHIIFDPVFNSEQEFLLRLARSLGAPARGKPAIELKEGIERYLFQKGVNENKTVVLVIDEGQKLTPANIEIVRTLLNYETNEYKLLQVVIFAQTEILPKLRDIPNFTERISLKYTINPLDERETKEMIAFRLKQAGHIGPVSLYTDAALKLIYALSQGCPRRITMFCHDALEKAVMRDKDIVDEAIVQELAEVTNERQCVAGR